MYKKISFIFCLFYSSLVFSQEELPAFWNVGGFGTIVPSSDGKQDYLSQIQLNQERILIQLYPGFTVVKASYELINLTEESLQFDIGYPAQGGFQHEKLFVVHYDPITALQVKINGDSVAVKQVEANYNRNQDQASSTSLLEYKDWYQWPIAIAPRDTSQIEVYFMSNTNYGKLIQGYARDYQNGFAFVLASGSAWAKEIKRGEILIEVKDSLRLGDILGVLPQDEFEVNVQQKQLRYLFQNLEPDSTHNLIIRYGQGSEEFDFEIHRKEAKSYYQDIDQMQTESSPADFEPFQANDFEIKDWRADGGFTLFINMLAFGFPALVLLVGGFTWWQYLRNKRNAKNF